METLTCMYCGEVASYSCSCVAQTANFCRKHRDTHERSKGNHVSRLLKELKLPDSGVKNALIQKINSAKKEAEKNLGLVVRKTSETVLLLQTQASNALRRLQKFMSICDEVIQEILRIEAIDCRKIHTPLESALISNNADHILSRIAAPVVQFFDSARFVSFTPSFFPHFFYNYSDLSINLEIQKLFQVFPSGKKITLKKFKFSSRMMNIGSSKLLFTGGENEKKETIDSAFILDIESERVTELAPLNIPRKWHSMTWVEGNPAVIGGNRNGNDLNNVEIFENNCWVEICPLIIARSSCTSICVQNIVWVIGGTDGRNRLDSIEKYYRGIWSLVRIRMPKPSHSVGLCSTGIDLLLLGGSTTMNVKMKNVYYFDTTNLCISEIKELEIDATFSYNQLFIDSDKVSALAKNSNKKIEKIAYNLNNIIFQ